MPQPVAASPANLSSPNRDSGRSAGATGELLRLPAVLRQTGLGRSTIYRLIACKQFPRPVRLTGRAVGWRKADLDQWTASLPTATH